MKLRRHAVTLLAALLVSTVAPRVYAQVKIAVVDMQRAINETEDGRKAKAQLKKLFDARQKTLDKQQNDLKVLKESIEKQKNLYTREVLAKKVEEYQKALVDLQGTYVEYQKELAGKEGELTQDIVARMQEILKRIGQREGYSLILERSESGVVFVPTNLDLTDQLIQRYNSGEGRAQ